MCAQFAPVAPPAALMAMKEVGILGNYHLLLAHDIYAQPDAYQAVFKNINPDAYIILDNSVIELGEPASLRMIEVAAATVRCNVVVLPDYMLAMEKTIDATKAACQKWKDLKMEYMICPQGKTLHEIQECMIEQMAIAGSNVSAVGVGRYQVGLLGSRFPMVKWIHSRYPSLRIHLLGFSDNLVDDVGCAMIPFVSGIDSAVPIRAGLRSVRLHMLGGGEIGPRGDYWEKADSINAMAVYNIQFIRKMIASRSIDY